MKRSLQVLLETFITSLPLLAIMLLVCVFVAPFTDPFDYIRLAVGYTGVIVGQSLFLVGLEASVLPIGKEIGASLIKLKKAAFIIFFGIMFGFFATVAEPAMWVLARQTNMIVEAVHVTVFVTVMGAGIGIFVGLALYRLIKNISIRVILVTLYAIIFVMVIFVPDQFIALAFDGSGVTTGDISVPFMLALGLGVSAAIRKRKALHTVCGRPQAAFTQVASTEDTACDTSTGDPQSPVETSAPSDDSFGIIGIASAGPIITVFLYGIILRIFHGGMPPEGIYNPADLPTNVTVVLARSLSDTLIALVPLVLAFLPFQFLFIKMAPTQFKRILQGLIPVFAGLLIFLFAIDFGFAFAGGYIGEVFMNPLRGAWFRWNLPIIGFVLGLAITLTEPAVTVLGDQLQEMIGIKRMTTRMFLGVSIGFSAMLAIIKIMMEINILWFLVPLYLVAVIMMKFTPKLFVGLAFDSGGVVGGALSTAVLTPLTLGIAQAVATKAGENAQSILTNGFGILAFISVTPLIAIQVMGMVYSKSSKENLANFVK